MYYPQHIHINDYKLDEDGIRIDYLLINSKKERHYLVPRQYAGEVLQCIGNSINDPLSQYDAILLVADCLNDPKGERFEFLHIPDNVNQN